MGALKRAINVSSVFLLPLLSAPWADLIPNHYAALLCSGKFVSKCSYLETQCGFSDSCHLSAVILYHHASHVWFADKEEKDEDGEDKHESTKSVFCWTWHGDHTCHRMKNHLMYEWRQSADSNRLKLLSSNIIINSSLINLVLCFIRQKNFNQTRSTDLFLNVFSDVSLREIYLFMITSGLAMPLSNSPILNNLLSNLFIIKLI